MGKARGGARCHHSAYIAAQRAPTVHRSSTILRTCTMWATRTIASYSRGAIPWLRCARVFFWDGPSHSWHPARSPLAALMTHRTAMAALVAQPAEERTREATPARCRLAERSKRAAQRTQAVLSIQVVRRTPVVLRTPAGSRTRVVPATLRTGLQRVTRMDMRVFPQQDERRMFRVQPA